MTRSMHFPVNSAFFFPASCSARQPCWVNGGFHRLSTMYRMRLSAIHAVLSLLHTVPWGRSAMCSAVFRPRVASKIHRIMRSETCVPALSPISGSHRVTVNSAPTPLRVDIVTVSHALPAMRHEIFLRAPVARAKPNPVLFRTPLNSTDALFT